MKNLITFSLLSILSLVLLSHAAFANPVGRKALNEISDATIQKDLAAALIEMSPGADMASDAVADYIFCPSKATEMPCKRYVLVDAVERKGEEVLNSRPFALEYVAEIENGKPVINSSWDYSFDKISLDRGNVAVMLLALPFLEKDYTSEAPIKSKEASHPFQVRMTFLNGNSESFGSGDEKSWESRSNYLVHFSESGWSTVVAFTFGTSYLVRTKEQGDQITKSDVKRLLKLDETLN